MREKSSSEIKDFWANTFTSTLLDRERDSRMSNLLFQSNLPFSDLPTPVILDDSKSPEVIPIIAPRAVEHKASRKISFGKKAKLKQASKTLPPKKPFFGKKASKKKKIKTSDLDLLLCARTEGKQLHKSLLAIEKLFLGASVQLKCKIAPPHFKEIFQHLRRVGKNKNKKFWCKCLQEKKPLSASVLQKVAEKKRPKKRKKHYGKKFFKKKIPSVSKPLKTTPKFEDFELIQVVNGKIGEFPLMDG